MFEAAELGDAVASMTPRLRAAIELLYVAFGDYRIGELEGCPHCGTWERERTRLRSAPLRELSEDALSSYSICAVATFGTLEELKHFTPRLLELIAQGKTIDSVDVVVRSLQSEGPLPETERAALVGYVEASIAASCSADRVPHFDEMVDAARALGTDLGAFVSKTFLDDAPSASPYSKEARATGLAELVGSVYSGTRPDGERRLLRSGPGHAIEESRIRRRALDFLAEVYVASPEHADANAWAEAHDLLMIVLGL